MIDSLDPNAPDNLDAAGAFAALGSEARLAILRALVRAGPDGLPVGAIQERVGLAPSTLSHHLRALTTAGVVVQRREGRVLNCLAEFERISALAQFLISECCVDAASEPQEDVA
ncbi:MAG: metalloregulator ArsR/SmtB family transcription factor [Pseudomonadota bacterium]